MDLKQLRYFIHVVESGSFSTAAAKLHVTQPALSHHVRQMEEELGVTLLHRSPRGIQPTDAGVRLREHAKRILDEFADIADNVRGLAALPRGEVCFGMPGTVSERLAVPLIEATRKLYPDIRIRIVEAMSGYILQWLKSGHVELAMVYSTPDSRTLALHHGLSEEICLFASAESRMAPAGRTIRLAEALRLPLVLPGPGHGLRELVDEAARAAGVAIGAAVEIDSYAQIKKLVARGSGYGILPRTAVESDVAAGTFFAWHFTDPAITREVHLAYSTLRPLPAAARAVAQLSWNILRELVLEKHWIAELSDDENDPRLY